MSEPDSTPVETAEVVAAPVTTDASQAKDRVVAEPAPAATDE